MPILNNTLVTLRQGLMNYIKNDIVWFNGTTSASAAASAKTLADSVGLLRFADDTFNTHWSLLTSGSNSTNTVKVSDFTQSTGVATLLSAYTAAIAASVSYEFLPFDPADIRLALNRALREAYHKLFKSIVNEDLITGNALPNSDFEDWAAAANPNHWGLSVATAAKNTSTYKYGRASAAITGGVSAGYMSCGAFTGISPSWLPLMDLRGFSIDFEAWLKTDTASHARLQITDSGGSTYSSYHTGGDLWELLKVTRTITSGATNIGFIITANVNTKVTYVDRARAMNGPVSEYVLPSEFGQGNVKKVFIQHASAELNGDERPCDDTGWPSQPDEWSKPRIRYDERLGIYLVCFDNKPPAGFKMRLEGIEPQGSLSADADTVSLSDTHLDLLYPYAAFVLFSQMGNQEKATYYKARYDDLKLRLGMPSQSATAIFPWGHW